MSTTEQAKDILANNGYKVTTQRKRIIEILLDNTDRHMSAEEIYEIIKGESLDIGLATVYRALELFEELGIVHKLNFGDGRSRYELKEEEHHHHHLVCTGCNQVFEVAEDLLDQLEEKIEKQYRFKILGHHLKFLGLCKECDDIEKEKTDE